MVQNMLCSIHTARKPCLSKIRPVDTPFTIWLILPGLWVDIFKNKGTTEKGEVDCFFFYDKKRIA